MRIIFIFACLVALTCAYTFDVDVCTQSLSDGNKVLVDICECTQMHTEGEVSQCAYHELCEKKPYGYIMLFCFIAEVHGGLPHHTCNEQLSALCAESSKPGICLTFTGFPGFCLL